MGNPPPTRTPEDHQQSLSQPDQVGPAAHVHRPIRHTVGQPSVQGLPNRFPEHRGRTGAGSLSGDDPHNAASRTHGMRVQEGLEPSLGRLECISMEIEVGGHHRTVEG